MIKPLTHQVFDGVEWRLTLDRPMTVEALRAEFKKLDDELATWPQDSVARISDVHRDRGIVIALDEPLNQ
jgi:hypothetical protein